MCIQHTCIRWSRPFAIVTFKDHTKIRSKMASFSVEAMVRGYHVYQDIWTAVVGEDFPCKKEAGNTFDPFAVAVMRGDTNTIILYSFVSFFYRSRAN